MTTAIETIFPAGPMDDTLRARLRLGAIIGAAGLIGFGAILWIAANWDSFDKFARFALVGGAFLLACLTAILRPSLRIPAALVAFCTVGGLFALFGQVYQSGADAWQLFALWAALGLPLALAARHDVVFVAWVLVAFTGVNLWAGTTGGVFSSSANAPVLLGWMLSAAIPAGVYWLGTRPGAERSTVWAFRLAVLLAVSNLTILTVSRLFLLATDIPLYLAGLAQLAASIWIFHRMRPSHFGLMAMATLGVDIILIAGVVRLVMVGQSRWDFGYPLLVGLIAAGIVGGSATLLLKHAPQTDGTTPAAMARRRIWPVTILSGIGALFAAVPLLTAYFMLFGDLMKSGNSALVVGLTTLAGAIALLRRAKPLGFQQQFGFILMVTAGLLISLSLGRLVRPHNAAAILFVLSVICAVAIPVGWIRNLLGAAGVSSLSFFLAHTLNTSFGVSYISTAKLTAILVTLAAAAVLYRLPPTQDDEAEAPSVRLIDNYAMGFAALALTGLAATAGATFLMGGASLFPGGSHRVESGTMLYAFQGLSVAGTLLAALLLSLRTDALRTPAGLTVTAILVVLSALTTNLGVALLMLVVAIVSARRPLLALSAIAVLWIVGTFYYWLGWPLVQKAYLLIGMGAVLALVLTATRRATGNDTTHAAQVRPMVAAGLILLSATATSAIFGHGLWQKESIIRTGRTIYVALAPVDPRSLVQGDFMALRFALPTDKASTTMINDPAHRPIAIAKVDARNIATVDRLSTEEARPGAGELLLQLRQKNNRWSLGTDAWFFKEGTAKTFEAAKFGEFRVAADGDMILVGMADAELKPLR